MNEYQKKKILENKKNESDDSSSLQFLGSDKQNDDNNDEQNQDNDGQPTKKKIDYSQQIDKSNGPPRKKQRYSQQPVENNNNADSIFLYKPGVELPNLFNFTNLTIKVIIAAEYVSKDNQSIVKHKIFGTDTYSANSDCVCICLHSGIFGFHSFSQKKCEGIQVTFKVIKPKKNYNGSTKNGIVSETIKNYNGNAIKPESVKWLTVLGSPQNLQRYAANMRIPIGKTRIRGRPQNINRVVPLPETNLVYNMNNEPAFKYSIYNIADKGFNKNQFLIRKLDKKVLYLETACKQKYELYKYIEKTYFEAYRFSRLKQPIKHDNNYFSTHHPPLQTQQLETLESVVEWDEIHFGNSSIKVKDTHIDNIISFKFYPKSSNKTDNY